jgi:hypothetical protein
MSARETASGPAVIPWTRREHTFVLLSILISTLLTYFPIVFQGETFVLHDHLNYTIPSRAYLGESLRALRIPEWWDGVALGAPFAANPNHSALYPPAWVAAFAPGALGTDLVVLLHAFWLGLGGAYLAKRLSANPAGATFAGVTLLAGGFATSIAVNALPLLTFAWTPWILVAADHLALAPAGSTRWRSALSLAAASGAQLLTAEPAGVLDAWLLASALTLVRAERRGAALARLAGTLGASLALAAVVILPAWHLLTQSPRTHGIPIEEAGAWSLHPWRLLEWLLPRVLGTPSDPTSHLARAIADTGAAARLPTAWAESTYVGLPILALAAFAAWRRVPGSRALLVVSCAFVLLALGTFTPIYEAVRFVLVPERVVRYPERHLAGALVLWSALAGVGLTRLFASEISRRWARTAAAIAAIIACSVGTAALARSWLVDAMRGDCAAARPAVDPERALDTVLVGALFASLVAAAVALVIAIVRARPSLQRAAPWLIVAIVGLHLAVEAWSLHPTLSREIVDTPPTLLPPRTSSASRDPWPRVYRPQTVRPHTASLDPRVVGAGLHHTLMDNVGARYSLAHFPGWDPTHPSRLSHLWTAAERPGAGPRLLWLFGIDYAVLPTAVLNAQATQTMNDAAAARLARLRTTPAGDIALARNEARRPRAFVATHARVHASDDAVLNALLAAGPAFDAGAIHLSALDAPPRMPEAPPASDSLTPCNVQVDVHLTERVTLRCAAPRRGYAVLQDAYDRGWSATVDGRPAPILRADLLVRAVPIEAGAHVIEMRYETPGLRFGAWVSLAAWLALVVLLWRARRTARVASGFLAC